MKKYLPIILPLAGIKLLIHWVGNQNYGFHRDELLHLSVSEHLAWGYMEFPPFIAWIGKMAYLLFDYSLVGVRLFPTMAGLAILLLCCLMAKDLGGKKGAILLAGVCVLAFLPFYRNHTLFQPVAFDQLFWTLGFYFLVKYIQKPDHTFLLWLGVSLGLGMLNKYTMSIWAIGLVVGIFFYEKGKLYKDKWLYISFGITFLMFLPNLIWQLQHDIPFLKQLASLEAKQLDDIHPLEFGWAQLSIPSTFIISLIGIYALLLGEKLKQYRAVGVMVLVIFTTMWIMKAKAYYVFGIYPVLFAAGVVRVEALLSKRLIWVYVIAAILPLPYLYFIPQLTPILPIETYVSYKGLEEVEGRVELTGDYADMFGWEEQVALVDSVYRSLSPDDQANCVLWAENYGEAGALKILGKRYDLPNPISRHGSFWSWGYGNPEAAVWISLGNEQPSVEYVFEEVELVKLITHTYAIGEENGIPLYICRKPKIDIPQWCADYEENVFD